MIETIPAWFDGRIQMEICATNISTIATGTDNQKEDILLPISFSNTFLVLALIARMASGRLLELSSFLSQISTDFRTDPNCASIPAPAASGT